MAEVSEKDLLPGEVSEDQLEAEGEAGHAGHDPYKDGPYAHQPTQPTRRMGDVFDVARSWANKAAVGAGPQIEGLMAAALVAPKDEATALDSSADIKNVADAYRGVRDMGTKEHALSDETMMGQTGGAIGAFSTPLPFKPAAGATIPQRMWQAGKVGGGVGLVHGAVNSSGDLTKLDADDAKRVIVDSLIGGGGGVLGGATVVGVTAGVRPKLESFAEGQALRAAGLRGGIKNSIKKDLGISNMDEARKLGRAFLDTKLIPPVGSAEAVGKRAQGLMDLSGRTIDRTLTEADTTGLAPFDYKAFGGAARKTLDDASAVADQLSGQKARALADALEAQGERTPGSFRGANQAKSDAWKSARFDDDAPMSAVLYRKANAAARNDIQRQVGDVLGPDEAQLLNDANSLYGVGADAQKLAENASTRDAAKKGLHTGDVVAALMGAGVGGAHGGSIEGALAGVGAAIGSRMIDKYGHSTAARFSDFLAKRAANNTGGAVGGQLGSDAALAAYAKLLEDDKK